MQNTKLPTKLIPFFWHFIKQRPLAFAVFFASPCLIIMESVVLPYSLKMIVDAFTAFDKNRGDVIDTIKPALYLAGTAWVAMMLFFRLQEWWQVHVLPKFEATLRMTVFNYVINHSYEYFSGNLSGNIANKIGDIPRSFDSLFMSLRWNVIATLAVSISIIAVVFTINPLFAGIIFLWIVIDVALSFSFVKYINKASAGNAEDKSMLSGRIVDTVANIISVKLFSRKSDELKYIQDAQNKEIKSNQKLRWRLTVFHFFIDFPVSIMWVIMGYMLIKYWQSGLISTGDLVFIFNSIWSLMFRLWFLGEALAEIFKTTGVVNQALTIVTKEHDLVDSKNAKPLKITNGTIEFKDVTFHYNRGNSLFENKNVVIDGGQKVGLVGFSGSGKTTFVNLILRFFDVESGRILIDGQATSDVTQDSLRGQISMIPQDTSLFHRTLMENIRYGKIDASDEEVLAAAKRAYCDDFIQMLPEKYEALVGERGVKLSGGQRQRIAIARAMLKNAPILILDEATSALDSVTEKHIQASLQDLMNGRTTIVVAHRLSTLSEMDRILVFDKGSIIEDGTHNELLKLNGHYAKMWQMQSGGFLPEKEDE